MKKLTIRLDDKFHCAEEELECMKATMLYENFDIPSDIIKIISDNMEGKFTNKETRDKILEIHGLV